MIIRIFIALLALNMLAFVVRAEAGERAFVDETQMQDVYRLQEEMSGDFEGQSSDMFATIGSRLLSLSLTNREPGKHRYASSPAQPDHGVAVLQEGACLNFKWKF